MRASSIADAHWHEIDGGDGAAKADVTTQGPLCGAFTTRVHDDAGRRWESRRYRKRGLQRHEVDALDERPPIDYWGWTRPDRFVGPPAQRAVTYWSGVCYLMGSILFVWGAAASLSATVFNDTNLYLWLVDVPYFVGSLCFWAGCYLLVLEAENAYLPYEEHLWLKRHGHHHEKAGNGAAAAGADGDAEAGVVRKDTIHDATEEEAVGDLKRRGSFINAKDPEEGWPADDGDGGRGDGEGEAAPKGPEQSDDGGSVPTEAIVVDKPPPPPPSYCWYPRPISRKSLAAIGAYTNLTGATAFTIGLCFSIASTQVQVSENAEDWGINLMFAIGGACFCLGGWVYAAEASHSFVRGLVPLSSEDMRRISFWINCLNFWGGAGFLLCGVLLFKSLSWGAYVSTTAVGYLAGSAAYLVASYGSLFELINPAHHELRSRKSHARRHDEWAKMMHAVENEERRERWKQRVHWRAPIRANV